MGFYTRNGNYIGFAVSNFRSGIFADGDEQFGRIGPLVNPTTTIATGIYDQLDVYNSRQKGIWPGQPVAYTPVAVNALPTLGTTSTSWPPAGWTNIINGSQDDANTPVNLPFSWPIAGGTYNVVYIGSNSYATFGGGSSNYNGLSASNPAFPKIMWGAADNSWQRVASFTQGTLYTRIRWEGNGSTSGTPGSSGMIVELTFFNPANTVGGGSLAELRIGVHNQLSGVALIASSSASYGTYTLAQSRSYTFAGSSTGTVWTINSISSVSY